MNRRVLAYGILALVVSGVITTMAGVFRQGQADDSAPAAVNEPILGNSSCCIREVAYGTQMCSKDTPTDDVSNPTSPFDEHTPGTEQTGRMMFGVGVNGDSGVVSSIVLDEDNFDIHCPSNETSGAKTSADQLHWKGKSLDPTSVDAHLRAVSDLLARKSELSSTEVELRAAIDRYVLSTRVESVIGSLMKIVEDAPHTPQGKQARVAIEALKQSLPPPSSFDPSWPGYQKSRDSADAPERD